MIIMLIMTLTVISCLMMMMMMMMMATTAMLTMPSSFGYDGRVQCDDDYVQQFRHMKMMMSLMMVISHM